MADNTNYRQIFLQDLPLIDTRAPIEFAKGAFPCAVSLPLMTDSERQKVGTCYKQQGQQAAIELGHQLVGGHVKEQRVQAWAEFARANPQGLLYCFRGGLRSQISQQWLKEAGVDYPRVAGGYKALRTFLLETLEQAVAECRFSLIDGLTGTGKTDVLLQLPNALDLEGHANHRGSSFGKHATGQPSQIDFENRIAIDLLKKRAAGIEHFVLENEARIVGSCSVPVELHRTMQTLPILVLEDRFENRVERILRDYVVLLREEFVQLHGAEQGDLLFAERLRDSMNRIRKRLGGALHQELSVVLDCALELQLRDGSIDAHRQWIERLLNDYYDPMYHYQQSKVRERVVFRGDQAAILAFVAAQQD
ncbi:MAG: tRNA 2-selenouridine(34) synthase MnmH [Thiopseudomonas sp.]|nr:tRNA 2-selenouridine(34) synthase MnmH [Thiopseudomonas sp.]